MNALKYIRLREGGSLNERTLKRAIVQKCGWAYEDFQTAEMVQDSTMCTLQGRFRKEDDENTCLQMSVDTLITFVRIVRRTREQHQQYNVNLSDEPDETESSKIAKLANKAVEGFLESSSLSDSLKFWQFVDNWFDPSRENDASYSSFCPSTYQIREYLSLFQ